MTFWLGYATAPSTNTFETRDANCCIGGGDFFLQTGLWPKSTVYFSTINCFGGGLDSNKCALYDSLKPPKAYAVRRTTLHSVSLLFNTLSWWRFLPVNHRAGSHRANCLLWQMSSRSSNMCHGPSRNCSCKESHVMHSMTSFTVNHYYSHLHMTLAKENVKALWSRRGFSNQTRSWIIEYSWGRLYNDVEI